MSYIGIYIAFMKSMRKLGKIKKLFVYFCLQTSLEYSSLMTGLGTSMPDIEEDEVESGPRLLPALSMATATPSTSVAQRSFQPVSILYPSTFGALFSLKVKAFILVIYCEFQVTVT
jgi:hypothetical protein